MADDHTTSPELLPCDLSPPEKLYISFADSGVLHHDGGSTLPRLAKWAKKPFEGATEYTHQPQSPSTGEDTVWEALRLARGIIAEDAAACRAFRHESEGPSGPENVLAKIDAVLAMKSKEQSND